MVALSLVATLMVAVSAMANPVASTTHKSSTSTSVHRTSSSTSSTHHIPSTTASTHRSSSTSSLVHKASSTTSSVHKAVSTTSAHESTTLHKSSTTTHKASSSTLKTTTKSKTSTSSSETAYPTYMVINKVTSSTPSGRKTPNDNNFFFSVTDPLTDTSTTCQATWSIDVSPSDIYIPCKNTTFSFQMGGYKSIEAYNITVRHQSQSKGQACLSTTGTNCISTYANMNATAANTKWKHECGASGGCASSIKEYGHIKVVSRSKGSEKLTV